MKSYWNAKKIIVLGILLLLGCDLSFICVAQVTGNDNAQLQQQLQQIQQLQQQAATRNLNNQPVLAQAPPPLPQGSAGTPMPQTEIPPPPTQNTQYVPVGPQTYAPADVSPGLQAPGMTTTTATTQTTQAAVSGPLPPPPPPQQLPPNYPQGGPGFVQPVNPPVPPATPAGAGVVSESEIRSQAFNAMTQNQLPMSPEQIQRLRQLFNQSQFAAASMPGTPPRPTATSQFVNLAPGSTPPVIRLAQGFVSSLVFIDASGAPWPIEAYDIGNPSAFNIQWNKSDNTLMIQATTLYTYGNLAVRLQGLNTPVMLTLIPGGQAIDYRVDLRIQAMGPNAAPTPVVSLPNSANPELLAVLDGVPPTGSTEVQVCGGGVQAWLRGDQLFVRTRYSIISPGWVSTMSSADGMHAYLMTKAPLLLAAQNGRVVQLKVEGV